MEKTVESIEAGLNSVRADVNSFKDEIRKEISKFVQGQTEKFVCHKYDVSEQVQNCIYNSRAEATKAISNAQKDTLKRVEECKDGLNTTVSGLKENLTEKLIDYREESRSADKTIKDDLTGAINHRVRIVGIITAVLLMAMGWLWSYSAHTSDTVEVFKDRVTQEISMFRDEIRSLISEDIRKEIFQIKSSQEKLLILLEAHNDEGITLDRKLLQRAGKKEE